MARSLEDYRARLLCRLPADVPYIRCMVCQRALVVHVDLTYLIDG